MRAKAVDGGTFEGDVFPLGHAAEVDTAFVTSTWHGAGNDAIDTATADDFDVAGVGGDGVDVIHTAAVAAVAVDGHVTVVGRDVV